jgi:pyrrolidone-carboxylate peptidase
MRILIYGFKPYGPYTNNISEQAVNVLSDRPNLEKKVFPVKFDYQMFYQIFLKLKPEIIIGLGQHPRARKLRIERKARNMMKTDKSRITPINKRSPEFRFANLTLPESELTTKTYNAGTYVCNFSMYVMADYCELTNARFGFIHIPLNMKVIDVKRYINNTLQKLAV